MAMQRDAEIPDQSVIQVIQAVSRGGGGGILSENFLTAAGQKRATLKGFLPEPSKLMELMMTNIGASIHHGCSQSIIAIRDCTKICKKLKGTLQVVSHSALHGPLSSGQVFPNEMHQ